MNMLAHRLDWLLWLAWLLLNAAGQAARGCINGLVGEADAWIVVVLLTFMLPAAAQAVLLHWRCRLPDAALWVPLSVGGVGVGIAVSILLRTLLYGVAGLLPFIAFDSRALAGPVGAGVVGVVVGAAQWLLLRRLLPWHAGWWLAASGAGWLAAFLVVEKLNAYLSLRDVAGLTISFAADGLVYGLLTGAVLAWLVRRGPSGPVSQHQRAYQHNAEQHAEQTQRHTYHDIEHARHIVPTAQQRYRLVAKGGKGGQAATKGR